MFPLFQEWRRNRRAERDLDALSDRELYDLGLTRADIPRAVRGQFRR